MDQVFNELMAWLPSIVFAVLVYALVLGQRKIVERIWKGAPNNWYWKEVLLPAGPFGTGAILAMIIPSWPFPEMFMEPYMLHVAFGVFLGAISGQVYRTLWAYLKKKKAEIEA